MRGWTRETLKSLPARAPPPRAGDRLAGIAEEDVAAELVLADVPLQPSGSMANVLRFIGRHTLEVYTIQLAGSELIVRIFPDIAA